MSIPGLDKLVGRSETQDDHASERQFEMLASLLDHDRGFWPEGVVPPLGHWLLFPPLAAQKLLGDDGHPVLGSGLIPDLGLPRRMWAGSRVQMLRPVALNSATRRETSISNVVEKNGRSGRMLFITLSHSIKSGGETAIIEEQDLVYRSAPALTDTPPLREGDVQAVGVDQERRVLDNSALFRFSALTFNAHRIHYDLPYAHYVEQYPGLVVQGPFLATLLMDFFLRRHPGANIRTFNFRAKAPVFAAEPFILDYKGSAGAGSLCALNRSGEMAMEAQVLWT
jgi:3-methylfumaryl-CoA hydratase